MAVVGHGLADAVCQEPSRAIGAHAEVTHELMGGNALLTRRHQVNGEQPLMQRNVRTLHNGSGAAGELAPAIVAEKHAGLLALFHAAHDERSAEWAGDAIRPARGFDMLAGGVFVVKAGGSQIGH